MAEENLPRSAPETGTDSSVDPSLLADRRRTPPMRRTAKRRRNIVILVVIVVVLVAGLFLWRYLSSYESTDDAQADVHLYPVSARVSGYVVRVNVGDNQWVEKGTVLVEIDPKDSRSSAIPPAPRDRPREEPQGPAHPRCPKRCFRAPADRQT